MEEMDNTLPVETKATTIGRTQNKDSIKKIVTPTLVITKSKLGVKLDPVTLINQILKTISM
jgi:hypothetical protein